MPKSLNLRGMILLRFGLIVTIMLTVIFLATFYFGKPEFSLSPYYRKQQVFRNPKIQLQQNGDYWVLHNFIKAPSMRSSNRTVTLTTHATYQDFANLQWLIVRWEAPISLAVFVPGDDFNRTFQSLCYLKFCTDVSTFFNTWVSVHLVFHNKHLPFRVERLGKYRPENFFCSTHSPYRSSNQNETYWYQRKLKYPVNLLRNVARLNAKTYYVLTMDTLLLPTLNFPRYFMSFAHSYTAKKPLKTVYCVPIFPQFVDQAIPKYKSELYNQMYPLLESKLAKKSALIDSAFAKWRQWLFLQIQDGLLDIYGTTDELFHCSAYVSVNTLEPFYEQTINESMYDSNSTRLLLLKALNFDFIVLDGTFLIKRLRDTWLNVPEPFPPISHELKTKIIANLKKLYSLTLWHSA